VNNDLTQAALATWAAKDIPARLLAGQVAKLLNCSTDDVAILTGAGKLRALGKPKPNAVKFFSSIELITLLADPDWLDDATKTIGQYWRRKNARRIGLKLADNGLTNDSGAPSPSVLIGDNLDRNSQVWFHNLMVTKGVTKISRARWRAQPVA
jgi:hypothetical protein